VVCSWHLCYPNLSLQKKPSGLSLTFILAGVAVTSSGLQRKRNLLILSTTAHHSKGIGRWLGPLGIPFSLWVFANGATAGSLAAVGAGNPRGETQMQRRK